MCRIRALAALLCLVCVLLTPGLLGAQEARPKADEMVARDPVLAEMFRLRTTEEREAWVVERARSDHRYATLLPVAAVWFERERRWDRVRELARLQMRAAEVYDQELARQDSHWETKERLLASAHTTASRVAIPAGQAFEALQHALAALDYLERAMQKRAARGLPPLSEMDRLFHRGREGLLSSGYLQIHRAYHELSEYRHAADYERKAYEIIAASPDLDLYSIARTFEARAAAAAGHHGQALEIMERAVTHVFAEPFPRGTYFVPLVGMIQLNVLAATYAAHVGDIDRAIAHVERAIELHRKKGDGENLLEAALKKLQIAHQGGKTNVVETTLAAIEHQLSSAGGSALAPSQLYRLALFKAQTELAKAEGNEDPAHLRAADAQLAFAIEVADAHRGQLRQAGNIPILERWQEDVFALAVGTRVRLHRATGDAAEAARALAAAEQSASQWFLDDVAKARANLVPAGDLIAKTVLDGLDNDIGKIVVELSATAQADERVAKVAKLAELRKSRDRQVATMSQQAPRLAELLKPQHIGLESLRSLIDDDQVVVRFARSDAGIAAWAITRTELHLAQLPVASGALDAHVARFRQHLAQATAEDAAAAQQIGAELYDTLLAPVLSPLRGRYARLAIVPVGNLAMIPFEALMMPAEAGKRMFLVERFETVYAPSLSIFAMLVRHAARERPGPPWLFAVADPDYSGSGAAIARSPASRLAVVAARRGLSLSPLPGTRREVERIAAAFPSRRHLLFGRDASVDSVKASTLSDYDFVHLAAHGILPGQVTGIDHPSIALTPGDANDGLLTFFDIVRLGFKAYLTVVSACNTAIGPAYASEGMISFTRALLGRSSDHALTSLWEVDDAATAMLMVEFYRRVLGGERPGRALRQAKLAMIRTTIEDPSAPAGSGAATSDGLPGRWPAFWSAFILHGGDTAVRFVDPGDDHLLGSAKAPVRTSGIPGQRWYLGRLRCPDGTRPGWKRHGNVGVGVYGSIVDLYVVECSDGTRHGIHLDAYHQGHFERRPVPGFTIGP